MLHTIKGRTGFAALLVVLALAACGDPTATSQPAATTALAAAATTAPAAAATTAPAAAATTAPAAAATTAASTTAPAGGATTAAGTTAAATTAPATTAPANSSATTAPPPTATLPAAQTGITPNTSVSGNIRIAIQPSSPKETELVNQQLANFFAAYPQVKVTIETVTDDKLRTEIASGDPPDVFYVGDLRAPDFIADKLIEPLDDLAKKYNVKFSDYQDNLIKTFTGQDGKVYGLPKDFNTLAMVYNTKYLSDAGVTAPPTTYDELKTTLQKIKDAGKLPANAAPFVVDPDMARLLPYFYAQGGTVLNSDKTKSNITQGDLFTNTLNYFVDLRKANLAKKASEVGASWSGEALSKGVAAIVFEGGWINPTMKDSPNAGNYALAELPKGKQNGNLIFTVAYSVAAKSKSKDAAFALVSYLTGEASENLTAKSGLAIPSRKAQTDVAVGQYSKEFKAVAAGVAYASPFQFGVGFGGFLDKANPVLQKVFGDNSAGDAQTQIDKITKDTLASQ